jgi:hypothetical protein
MQTADPPSLLQGLAGNPLLPVGTVDQSQSIYITGEIEQQKHNKRVARHVYSGV